jgi:hypothetical protein
MAASRSARDGFALDTSGSRGCTRTVRAAYVVAADGHHGGTREALGIGRHGRGVLGTAMSIVFEAGLSRVLNGRGVVLYHMRGALPGATFVTTDDPGRHNVHVGVGDGEWDEARCTDAVRVVTGVPDLDVRVLSSAPWDTAAWVADTLTTAYAAMVDRTAPDRRDATVAAPIDPATFLFGFRYLDGAFTPVGAGERYENPDALSGSPGSRLPLLPGPADPRGHDLTLLTAWPDWAAQAEWTAAAAGTALAVRLVPDAGPTAGWTQAAGTGAHGAVLVRPDRYVAWRSPQQPGAADFGRALRVILDK